MTISRNVHYKYMYTSLLQNHIQFLILYMKEFNQSLVQEISCYVGVSVLIVSRRKEFCSRLVGNFCYSFLLNWIQIPVDPSQFSGYYFKKFSIYCCIDYSLTSSPQWFLLAPFWESGSPCVTVNKLSIINHRQILQGVQYLKWKHRTYNL